MAANILKINESSKRISKKLSIYVQKNNTSRYFDLLGRQLLGNPNKKGIYINKGKKVTVP